MILACLSAILACPAAHAGVARDSLARLDPGAFELDGSLALTSVERVTETMGALGVEWFLRAPGGLVEPRLEVAFSDVGSLSTLDLGASLAWNRRFGELPEYGFLGVGGGIRQEWLGSFAEARYPLGFDLGLRVLFGSRAGMRIGYRFRRILGDPVADFSEHRVLVGLSVFFRNPSPAAAAQLPAP